MEYKGKKSYRYIGFKRVKSLFENGKLNVNLIGKSVMVSNRALEYLKEQGVKI